MKAATHTAIVCMEKGPAEKDPLLGLGGQRKFPQEVESELWLEGYTESIQAGRKGMRGRPRPRQQHLVHALLDLSHSRPWAQCGDTEAARPPGAPGPVEDTEDLQAITAQCCGASPVG